MRNRILGICLAVVAIASTGCAVIHNANGTTSPASPMENVLTWNASLATSNKALADAVIQANNLTPPVLDVQTSNSILTQQSIIADDDRQLTQILMQACTNPAGQPAATSCNMALLTQGSSAIQNLITGIGNAAGTLVINGTVNIKDPKTVALVQQTINSLKTLAGQIVTGLQSAGVLK